MRRQPHQRVGLTRFGLRGSSTQAGSSSSAQAGSRSPAVISRAVLARQLSSSHRQSRGTGDSVTKVLRLAALLHQVFDHLLDQEVAERDAAQSLLAVGDRVEHRRRGLVARRRPSSAPPPAPTGCCRGWRRISATSTKISGSSISEGWKKAKQRRSVGIEAAAQVVPALDLVHRLVGDDLVEDGRRRLPVDAAQHQEAAVEPGRQADASGRVSTRASAGSPRIDSSRSRRMATISAVAPGARFRRRKNSWRGLSTAACSAATWPIRSDARDRPWRRASRRSGRAAGSRPGTSGTRGAPPASSAR